jgi:hypothetical protein
MKELIIRIRESEQGNFLHCHIRYGDTIINYRSSDKSSMPILINGELDYNFKLINEKLEKQFIDESLQKAKIFFNELW